MFQLGIFISLSVWDIYSCQIFQYRVTDTPRTNWKIIEQESSHSNDMLSIQIDTKAERGRPMADRASESFFSVFKHLFVSFSVFKRLLASFSVFKRL